VTRPGFRTMAGLGMIDAFVVRLLSFLTFAALARILPRSEIGALGVAQGAMAVLAFIDLCPEAILFRDYVSMKGQMARYLGAYLLFWALKSALMLLAAAMIGAAMAARYAAPALLLITLGYAAAARAASLGTLGREVSYIEGRQAIIVLVNAATGAAVLGAVICLSPRYGLAVYLLMLLVQGGVQALFWLALLARAHGIRWPRLSQAHQVATDIRHSVMSYALWTHLSGVSTGLLYRSDVFVLSALGTPLSLLGTYSICLSVANWMVVVPQMLEKALLVTWAPLVKDGHDGLQIRRLWLRWAAICCGFTVAVWLAWRLGMGAWLVKGDTARANAYIVPLIGGITIRALVGPVSVLAALCCIKRYVAVVYAPALAAGLAVLVALVLAFGVLGAAWANVAMYGIVAAWSLAFAYRDSSIRGWLRGARLPTSIEAASPRASEEGLRS